MKSRWLRVDDDRCDCSVDTDLSHCKGHCHRQAHHLFCIPILLMYNKIQNTNGVIEPFFLSLYLDEEVTESVGVSERGDCYYFHIILTD